MPGGCVTGSLLQHKNFGKPPSSTAPLKPAKIPAEGAETADGVGERGLDSKGGGRRGSDSRGRGPEGYRQQGTRAGGAQAARDVGRRGTSCRGLGQDGYGLQGV